jgi:hypothetical protein
MQEAEEDINEKIPCILALEELILSILPKVICRSNAIG